MPQFSQLQRETKGGAFALPKTVEHAAEDKTRSYICKSVHLKSGNDSLQESVSGVTNVSISPVGKPSHDYNP